MNAKRNNPSGKEAQPTTAGKDVAEIENSDKNNHDSSDDLSADELAAFNKIMGDIEGKEEEEFNAGDTDMPGSTNAGGPQSETDDDQRLDEDQQQAFESIMAQIEGGGDVTADSDSGKSMDEAPESATADDFSAELEMVIKEADADDIDSAKATDDAPESATMDDFSAELEMVVNEANADDTLRSAETKIDASDDGLDEDQQKAFEKIMAQIEGGEAAESDTRSGKATDDGSRSETATRTSAQSVPKDRQPEEAPADQRATTAGSLNEETVGDTQDISDDIEDLLREITSSEDGSPSPEMTTHEPDAKLADDTASEAPIDEDRVALDKENNSTDDADSPSVPLSSGNSPPPESDEKSPDKDPADHQPNATQPNPTRLQTPLPAKPQHETANSNGGRQQTAIMALLVVALFLAPAGYNFWTPKGTVDSKSLSTGSTPNHPDVEGNTEPATQPPEPVAVVQRPSDQSRLKRAVDDLDRLRNELIEKQAEIEQLRVYYQAGIDAEIQGIVDMLRQTGNGSISHQAAMDDPHICLGLAAIQRRHKYITKLETPAKALFWNSEELLYFSRKAELVTMMVGKTSDIDIDGFIKAADDIRKLHSDALSRLNIDAVPAVPPVPESIWQDIVKRLSMTPVTSEKKIPQTVIDNTAIWKNICEGDFSRKHNLTVLSPEAARCLAAWKGKDLFLNELTELSAESARQLAAWPGEWLGLNGLKELSPEAAVHLSQWKGKGLSLNGLSHLSPRVVAILSEWQGDQIELVNVKHMGHWENPKTRLFLSEDLERKSRDPNPTGTRK